MIPNTLHKLKQWFRTACLEFCEQRLWKAPWWLTGDTQTADESWVNTLKSTINVHKGTCLPARVWSSQEVMWGYVYKFCFNICLILLFFFLPTHEKVFWNYFKKWIYFTAYSLWYFTCFNLILNLFSNIQAWKNGQISKLPARKFLIGRDIFHSKIKRIWEILPYWKERKIFPGVVISILCLVISQAEQIMNFTKTDR